LPISRPTGLEGSHRNLKANPYNLRTTVCSSQNREFVLYILRSPPCDNLHRNLKRINELERPPEQTEDTNRRGKVEILLDNAAEALKTQVEVTLLHRGRLTSVQSAPAYDLHVSLEIRSVASIYGVASSGSFCCPRGCYQVPSYLPTTGLRG
jgi:hypothetical protein